MAEKKTAGGSGRQAPDGEKKQFLTSMAPDVIRRIKAATALRDQMASIVVDEAAQNRVSQNEVAKGLRKRA